jgi:uncharacterized lipoprotein YmbA
MLVVSSGAFREKQAQYFDLADNREQVIIRRGKTRAYRLVPVAEDDYIAQIPEEYRCNPYDISPGGDMFWADRRNVEAVRTAVEQSNRNIADGLVKTCRTWEESQKYLESL